MVRLEELVAYDAKVRDPSNVKDLHDMRIAMKRLRYTLEIFVRTVDGSRGFLETMKTLQEMLGRVHDIEVLVARIESDAEPPNCAPGVAALLHCARGERRRCFDEFVGAWQGFLEEGFPGRLRAAAEASIIGLAQPVPDTGTLLPENGARHVAKLLALLRLARHAAERASPSQSQHLLRSLDRTLTIIAAYPGL